jgi:hypothetical protein
MYDITKYSFDRAKILGVVIKPSGNPNKKIDVFSKDGIKICSIGAIDYQDYPSYIKTDGIEYANFRRELYMKRHYKDIQKIGSKGWFAFHILW